MLRLHSRLLPLLTSPRAPYTSIIAKHPNGIPHRLHRYDQWVASWNDPHCKTYRDYWVNGEQRTFEMYMPECELSRAALREVAATHRPGLVDFHYKFPFNEPQFADDRLPSCDITKLSLLTFLKECLKKETRTDAHRLLMWVVCAVVTLAVQLGVALQMGDYVQKIVYLEPHEKFYHYNANETQHQVREVMEKVSFLNARANQVLEEAKEKAKKRRQSQ